MLCPHLPSGYILRYCIFYVTGSHGKSFGFCQEDLPGLLLELRSALALAQVEHFDFD